MTTDLTSFHLFFALSVDSYNTRGVGKHPENIYFKLFYLHFIDHAIVAIA